MDNSDTAVIVNAFRLILVADSKLKKAKYFEIKVIYSNTTYFSVQASNF